MIERRAAGIDDKYIAKLFSINLVRMANDEYIMVLLKTNAQTFGAAGGEEYLTFHLLTEMLMQKGGSEWETWYPLVRDKLIAVQNSDGSWTGHHCITSRTFSTACAMMVLSAPNRYLPISQV